MIGDFPSTRSRFHALHTFVYTRSWCGSKPLGLNERCFESSTVKGGCQGCLTAAIPLFLQTLWPLRWRATAAVEEQMLKGQYKVQRLRWDNKSLSLSLALTLALLLSAPHPHLLLASTLAVPHTHFSLWTLVFLCLLFRHTAHHLGHSTGSRSSFWFFFFTWLHVAATLSGKGSLIETPQTQLQIKIVEQLSCTVTESESKSWFVYSSGSINES